jgi:hypothetical protein
MNFREYLNEAFKTSRLLLKNSNYFGKSTSNAIMDLEDKYGMGVIDDYDVDCEGNDYKVEIKFGRSVDKKLATKILDDIKKM